MFLVLLCSGRTRLESVSFLVNQWSVPVCHGGWGLLSGKDLTRRQFLPADTSREPRCCASAESPVPF